MSGAIFNSLAIEEGIVTHSDALLYLLFGEQNMFKPNKYLINVELGQTTCLVDIGSSYIVCEIIYSHYISMRGCNPLYAIWQILQTLSIINIVK